MNAITIFGGTGDLTFRKLLPALYNMHLSGKLKEDGRIIIIGRREHTWESYIAAARDWVKKFSRLPYEDQTFDGFAGRVSYYRMDFSDASLYRGLDEYYAEKGVDSHLFYLAVAPRFFDVIVHGLGAVGGASKGKVILEKPFGATLEAARALNTELEEFFSPEGVYRIDHYLGKEMVRNIQTIRFTNRIFMGVWDSTHIESVQISAMEDVGVETRGGYYDTSGALKDMVQNHLFQILSIIAMERPLEFTPAGMHTEQLRVLRSLRADRRQGEAVVLGQYEGYRQEPLVAEDSVTETYAALRVFVDNNRWRGTPFYIRTGKKLGKREMQVTIIFRPAGTGMASNVLIIKIQPTEGVYLQFNIKKPGDTDETVKAKMDFCQSCSMENRINTPEAYERLLDACLKGERLWFSQWDQIETGWRFIDGLRENFSGAPYPYKPDTPGPKEADALLARHGNYWFDEEENLQRK